MFNHCKFVILEAPTVAGAGTVAGVYSKYPCVDFPLKRDFIGNTATILAIVYSSKREVSQLEFSC